LLELRLDQKRVELLNSVRNLCVLSAAWDLVTSASMITQKISSHSSQSQFLVAILFATLTLQGACTAPDAFEEAKNKQASAQPKPAVEDENESNVAITDRTEEDEQKALVEHEEDTRVKANESLSARSTALQSMDEKSTWLEKYPSASTFFENLEYQRWVPFESASKEMNKREELFAAAVKEFFILWGKYAGEVSDETMNLVRLDSREPAVQSLIALAQALDVRDRVQSTIAAQHGLDEYSVFGMIRGSLKNGRYKKSDKAFEQEVGTNEKLAHQALEWRANAKLLWAWSALDEQRGITGIGEVPVIGSVIAVRQLRLANMDTISLEMTLTKISTANYAINELNQIKGGTLINDRLKSRYASIRVDREERRLQREEDANRKNLGLKLIAEIRKLQTSLR